MTIACDSGTKLRANHGPVTAGSSPEAAVHLIEEFDGTAISAASGTGRS
jgi:ribulose-5-phosphate 4-epimerase/fuculose-1-phosphate aldolase